MNRVATADFHQLPLEIDTPSVKNVIRRSEGRRSDCFTPGASSLPLSLISTFNNPCFRIIIQNLQLCSIVARLAKECYFFFQSFHGRVQEVTPGQLSFIFKEIQKYLLKSYIILYGVRCFRGLQNSPLMFLGMEKI